MSSNEVYKRLQTVRYRLDENGETTIAFDIPPDHVLENTDFAVDVITEKAGEIASQVASASKVKLRYRHKRWLDIANNEMDKQKWNSIQYILILAADRIEDVLHCINTCLVECSNFRRLKYLRKDRFYYSSFAARSYLSALSEDQTAFFIFKLIAKQVKLDINTYKSKQWGDFWKDVKELLEIKEGTKKRRRRRKSSKMFKMRHAQLSKIKLEINLANSNVAEAKNRAYKSLKQKRLRVRQPLARNRGNASQAELQSLMDKGIGGIRKCAACAWIYRKNHSMTQCNNKTASAEKKRVKAVERALLKGVTKQVDLKDLYDHNKGNIKLCPKCGFYYKHVHRKCRTCKKKKIQQVRSFH